MSISNIGNSPEEQRYIAQVTANGKTTEAEALTMLAERRRNGSSDARSEGVFSFVFSLIGVVACGGLFLYLFFNGGVRLRLGAVLIAGFLFSCKHLISSTTLMSSR